jgi:hypothetical protein
VKPELYTEVLVTRDIPEENLKAGDTGWYIEYITHPHGGEDGAMLEIGAWDDSRVVIVPISAIAARPQNSDFTDESVKLDT